MTAPRLEYMGFKAQKTQREYTMRLHEVASEPRYFIIVIPSEAFRSERVRYQDGPDLCYQKMRRELLACEGTGTWPGGRLDVTDAEIDDYREAHTPKAAPKKTPVNPENRY